MAANSTSQQLHQVVIVGAARTPIGCLGGALSKAPAPELGAVAIRAALRRANVSSSIVDACYMGNVLTAGVGQAPARQAALAAGLPETCSCTTVNKVCASGLKAVTMAAQDVALGINTVVVAGGMECMSLVPYYVRDVRFGCRMGSTTMVDGIVHDGLVDPTIRQHMGMCAEACATKHDLSRELQDAYARRSYERSHAAWDEGQFDEEIEPVVTHVGGKDVTVTVSKDEECFRHMVNTLPSMQPAFLKDGTGTVTSGNSSGINDGAAAVVIMSLEKARELGCPVLARIGGYADVAQQPVQFTTAPALAIPKALARSGLAVEDVDVFEINEAFSVVALANMKLLNVTEDKVNVWGGAVSLGHPIGCSGTRILVTLLNVMLHRKARCGVAAICNGGGGATALVVHRDDTIISNTANL